MDKHEAYIFDKLAEAASSLGIRVPTLETPSAHRNVENFNECLRCLLQEDPTKRPSIQQAKRFFAFYILVDPGLITTLNDREVFHTTELWHF
jgi:hypothetical protein